MSLSDQELAGPARRVPRTPRTRGATSNTTQPHLAVTYRPLDALVPYVRNARTHKSAQIKKLKSSLTRFGWTNPLLIADGSLVAGHGRLIAAIELRNEGRTIKLTPSADQAPTIDLSHLSEADRRAYRLADNRLALDAGWDRDLLTEEFGWLNTEGIDLSVTGFRGDEIKRIGGTAYGGGALLTGELTYQVIVEARGETHQAELIERFRAEGLSCKPLIL